VASSADDFRKLLTDGQTNVEILLADWSGETVGFALFFKNFSTFLGKPGLYLEDLIVRPEFRGRGIGTAQGCDRGLTFAVRRANGFGVRSSGFGVWRAYRV
jgi:GNAT superfamily N-acetyltransferase